MLKGYYVLLDLYDLTIVFTMFFTRFNDQSLPAAAAPPPAAAGVWYTLLSVCRSMVMTWDQPLEPRAQA